MAHSHDGDWDWHVIFYRLLVWIVRGVVGFVSARWVIDRIKRRRQMAAFIFVTVVVIWFAWELLCRYMVWRETNNYRSK